ncbi:Ubiquitin-conjugating enzyme E2 11 [Savitreella phatthalungensis]
MEPAANSRKLGAASSGVDAHSVTKRLQSELMSLMMSSPPGISAFPESDANLFRWLGTIVGPDETPYAGLKFKLKIEFPANYPFSAPTITFTSPMWHPNVDMSGNICLDILKEKWSAVYNVQTILLSLQSLLGEPNNASPLNAQAADLWDRDMTEYKRLLMARYCPIEEI